MLAPTVPPAPGRFSMTNVLPSCRPTWSMTTRAMMSLAMPAASGTTTVTLRAGQSWADVTSANGKMVNATMAPASRIRRSNVIVASLALNSPNSLKHNGRCGQAREMTRSRASTGACIPARSQFPNRLLGLVQVLDRAVGLDEEIVADEGKVGAGVETRMHRHIHVGGKRH